MAPLLLRLLATSMTRFNLTSSSLTCGLRTLAAAAAPRLLPPMSSSSAGSTRLPLSTQHRPSLLGQCRQLLPSILPSAGMKTKSALKRRCKDCFFVRRRGRLFVFCKTHPRHKQRQG